MENKKLYVKIIAALILLGFGVLFYHLNIQNLNGEYFPAVCKMFVLPNVFGIAGLLMIGKCASSVELLDMKRYSRSKLLLCVVFSIIIIVIGYITDDYKYDFPIGKWGAFGEISYFITPVYGVALMILHFFIVWFISYIGGFWAPTSSGKIIPAFAPGVIWLHFIITLFITLATCSAIVVTKKNDEKN